MQRKRLDDLIAWFGRSDRKPLILRGARQVGKTTLVRLLARTLKLELIEINMEDTQTFIPLLEKNDPATLFEVIALERGMTELDANRVLIFFDEVQECPQLIAFLRYCHERAPQFRIIAAGSLLEFVLKDYQYAFPVGRVEFMYLGPMDFEEYLLAIGQQALVAKLAQFSFQTPLLEPVQRLLEKHVRDFLVCGGMPEAVKTKANNGSLLDIERVKTDIVEAYYADFPKYHKSADTTLLQTLFQRIPLQIGQKVRPAKLVDECKARDIWRHLEFLEQARLICRSTHSHAAEPPLSAGKVDKIIKLIFLDVGLVQTILGVTIPAIETTEDMNKLAKGALAEQYIGQHLMYQRPYFQKPELYHWDRPVQGSEAEVDYLVSLEGRILPVEVKSGAGGTMKALRLMLQEKGLSTALRFYSGPPRIDQYRLTNGHSYQLVSLPHYLIGQWPRLMQGLF